MTIYENTSSKSYLLPIKSRNKKELILFFQMKNANLKSRINNIDSESKGVYQKLYHLTDFYLKNIEETESIDEEKYLEIIEFYGLHCMLDLAHSLTTEKDEKQKEKIPTMLECLNNSLNDKTIFFKQAYGYIPLEEIQNDPLILHRKELSDILSKLPTIRNQIEIQKKDIPNKIDKRLLNTETYIKELNDLLKDYNALLSTTYNLEKLIIIIAENVKKANPDQDLDNMSKKVIQVANHFNKIIELATMDVKELGDKFKLEGEIFLITQGIEIDLSLEQNTSYKKIHNLTDTKR